LAIFCWIFPLWAELICWVVGQHAARAESFRMSADPQRVDPKPKVRAAQWLTAIPVVMVLMVNVIMERVWPTIPSATQAMILLATVIVSFGITFGIAWLIARRLD
jgi:hypothetical protein